jgi:hypothetical protein
MLNRGRRRVLRLTRYYLILGMPPECEKGHTYALDFREAGFENSYSSFYRTFCGSMQVDSHL